MARCPHCGEPVSGQQENCYACGHKVRARGYKAPHHVNPLVFVGAGLMVIVVLGAVWVDRNNTAKKEAALRAEEESLRVEDSARRAAHDWLDALRAAQDDPDALAVAAALEDIESRFQSVRMRVASRPTPRQESIIGRVQAGLEELRRSAVILASTPEAERQTMRDSIEVGKQLLEGLARELGNGR